MSKNIDPTGALPTTGSIDKRIGKLEVRNGYPIDEMDFQRAVQAYLWALPYVSMGQFQSEQRDKFGASRPGRISRSRSSSTRARRRYSASGRRRRRRRG